MFVAGYCSFLAQSCTVLPQSCGSNWGTSTPLKVECVVCAGCEMTVWEPSRSHVTDEETKGDAEKTWQDYSRIIPVLNFHMPKDFVLLYLPSVFDLFEGEAISQKFWSWNSSVCVIDWIINRCLGLSLP